MCEHVYNYFYSNLKYVRINHFYTNVNRSDILSTKYLRYWKQLKINNSYPAKMMVSPNIEYCLGLGILKFKMTQFYSRRLNRLILYEMRALRN
ncbi:hypothetical protein PRUPE_2G104400 [Prunus persica]|uniref:Uncharacterized protein n=1 Tax=Prunus persica TaxID=3760 RepID=A0A251QE82_PRUPE|nr:hypothetical protein PRUPE_2G104400 [Prunus persica]